MSHIAAGNVGGSLGRPLYQRKVIANPSGLADGAAASGAAPTPAAQVTIQSAAPQQGRTQQLTQQLDEKLTSSLTRIRQKIGNGSSGAGVTLDVSA